MKIYLAKRPQKIGGGSNTFVSHFSHWAKKNGNKIVRSMKKADAAIIIAHFGEIDELKTARLKGCFLIHRLDEYFDINENERRQLKHKKIIELNKFIDVTVFQSRFVFENVYPHIKSNLCRIIHNGSDPELFFPLSPEATKATRKYIGHVSWSVGFRKRLDLLHEFIVTHPNEQFLLIGRHKESQLDFNLPNVRCVGKVKRKKMPKYYKMMKMLFFPSEKDPCPNTVIEAILSGVPVCYNPGGGTTELVNGPVRLYKNINPDNSLYNGDHEPKIQVCGLPLHRVDEMMENLEIFRGNCLKREDLNFKHVFKEYYNLINEVNGPLFGK